MTAVCHAQVQAPRSALNDMRAAQVQAAMGNATGGLRDQIMLTPVMKNLAVHDLVDRLGDSTFFARAMQNASQVGGPRWIDNQTCQVRMQLPGGVVANMLLQDARQRPDLSPIGQDDLKLRLGPLARTTFFATGSSVAGEVIEQARPHNVEGAWAGVNEAARRRAIAAARQDAIAKVLANLANIQLTKTLVVQMALDRPGLGNALSLWLYRQPVTRVEFQDDLRVSVTLAASGASLSAALQSAVMSDKEFSRGISIDWSRVQRDVAGQVGPIVGSASATLVPTTAPVAETAGVLPNDPPDWVNTQLDAQAIAATGGSRLKIARSAEAVAMAKLRKQLLSLSVGQITLDDAVKANPQLGQAVDRVMIQAHTYKVDYRADGSVLVRVSLDLRNAWDDLHGNP